ncbi:adenine phosphoribosyltransferase [Luteibacter rhizovicinus]|uniref:Adenine phosphoribosyltransferase n=1 Tax=Luteibacter rhizovicinus TaxID=242606 RepID=A0A4R3YMT7_9GAMM|nr:adenine phosphoribosyltransferase [Luteibacter rhizovicinus]TCV93947.1 adenine phosphoribosyltransferase [Luteibacter rhizovicinus]
MQAISDLIRDVPDFPRPGVLFKDISPLLADADGFALCIEALADPWRQLGVQAVCGIESRGFIFGAALARTLHAGFVPVRKKGKLPPPVIGIDYGLEYGVDRLEVGASALRAGERVLIVDDVLATGGTLEAARRLVDGLGAEVVGGSVVIELAALAGRPRWTGATPLHALILS